jgi:hypothetical protein
VLRLLIYPRVPKPTILDVSCGWEIKDAPTNEETDKLDTPRKLVVMLDATICSVPD